MKGKQIQKLLKVETSRQTKAVNLIASENYVSDDVLLALGSVFTNKYAEGYAGKRYYGGNSVVDDVERLAIARALSLFDLSPKKWAVNVQSLSGSSANLAVYAALLPKGGRIMGMNLSDGGHLTHGHHASLSGKIWTQVPYGVDPKTEVLDYDAVEKIAIAEKPNIIVAGYTAYPRVVDWKRFRKIADKSGAIFMADISHLAGLIAGKAYPSPFPYADIVTTTTHKTLRGPRSAMIFSRINPREFPAKIDKAVFPLLQGGPHINQIASVAVALDEAAKPAFKKYAAQVIKNARILAGTLQKKGWRVISGGTDSHMVLIDTWMGGKGISGGNASALLETKGVIVNKNTIPADVRNPQDPSGIRLGTAAETTRGKKEKDFVQIAEKIDNILRSE